MDSNQLSYDQDLLDQDVSLHFPVGLSIGNDDDLAPSLSSVPTYDGLLVHLDLDEISGDKLANSIPGGKDDLGKLEKGAIRRNSGNFLGGAVQFDGEDDHIKLKKTDDLNKDVLSQRTVSIWFQVDDKDLRDRKQVIYEEGDDKDGLNIYLDHGRLYVGGWNEPKDDKGTEGSWSGSYVWSDQITSGQWHHVALVLDAEADTYDVQPSALLAYLDGVNFGEAQGSQLKKDRDDIALGNVRKSTQFHDGDVKDKAAKRHGLRGSIGDVQIYNQALSADDIATLAGLSETPIPELLDFEIRSLNGRGNNINDPTLGEVGTPYARVSAPNYADGISEVVDAPNARYISNRVFNDSHVNLFSEREVTQWAFNWGQFLDHSIGLREAGNENAPIAFDASDPLEEFRNDAGVIRFQRSAAADGTGVNSAREQNNIISSFIDGWAIYGGTEERLEWLREGPVDGDLSNNGAKLLLVNGYLPRANTRGDLSAAPEVALQGGLRATPEKAFIAGDVRANENIALTSTHTLFAREHNRIVDALPTHLDEEQKFQLARRIVGAEQQYITYNQYLPTLGIHLDAYEGYDPTVDPRITNEFATVGFRAHSMIHGDFDLAVEKKDFSKRQLRDLEAKGVLVDGDDIEVPLNIAFGNPDLVPEIGLEGILGGLEAVQYNNDETIDNQLRSILFEQPQNPNGPLDGAGIENNFTVVTDLGAIDIERGRDHGIASYNDLREAYGLNRVQSFTEITGESTEQLPAGLDIDDPEILLFDELLDERGKTEEKGADKILEELEKGEEVGGVFGIRRSTLAGRLKAIYGDVDQVDAFVGLVSEPHVPGTEFGELQLAIWKEQFEDLRDGDRFFYGNDPVLDDIEARYGISYKVTLADVISNNTDLNFEDLNPNVFIATHD